ncbi:tetratricopeptide repeat protein [Caballeronia sp. INDeC2]|uniref:tetratricopeptide repeat protein n=1 Tax=Caballeronia sp. INDeC2 TaxID=2921747 RepID=UPI002028A0B1|nr:tetratricopeptide repeat protein [Caballeronia sp. INDeC2]
MKRTDQSPQSLEYVDQDTLETVTGALSSSEVTSLTALDELIAVYPGDPRLHFLRGAVLASLARYDEAQYDLQRCITIDPLIYVSWFMLGFIQLLHGQLEEARRYWAKLSELPSDDTLRSLAHGLDLLVEDQFERARTELNATLDSNVRYPELNSFIKNLLTSVETRNDTSAPVELGEQHFLMTGYLANSTRH